MFKRKRATLIVQLEGKKGILIARHIFHRKWGLPGGGIKFGERAEESAKRELKEEFGLIAENVKFLFEFNSMFQKHIIYLVSATGKIKKNWEIGDFVFSEKHLDLNLTRASRKILEIYWRNRK